MEIKSSCMTVISGNRNFGSWKVPRGFKEKTAQTPGRTCVVVTAGSDAERDEGDGDEGDGDAWVFLS